MSYSTREIDRFAAVYTPIVLVLAIALAVLAPLVMDWSWHDAAYQALALLVISCPCALVLSTPVTVVSALTAAARRGLLIDLGHGQVDDLDTAPPLSLLALLSQRSGIELDRLRCMSFAGWVPWLLDSLDDQIPDALETYAFQLSVLLPRLRRKTRSIQSWPGP